MKKAGSAIDFSLLFIKPFLRNLPVSSHLSALLKSFSKKQLLLLDGPAEHFDIGLKIHKFGPEEFREKFSLFEQVRQAAEDLYLFLTSIHQRVGGKDGEEHIMRLRNAEFAVHQFMTKLSTLCAAIERGHEEEKRILLKMKRSPTADRDGDCAPPTSSELGPPGGESSGSQSVVDELGVGNEEAPLRMVHEMEPEVGHVPDPLSVLIQFEDEFRGLLLVALHILRGISNQLHDWEREEAPSAQPTSFGLVSGLPRVLLGLRLSRGALCEALSKFERKIDSVNVLLDFSILFLDSKNVDEKHLLPYWTQLPLDIDSWLHRVSTRDFIEESASCYVPELAKFYQVIIQSTAAAASSYSYKNPFLRSVAFSLSQAYYAIAQKDAVSKCAAVFSDVDVNIGRAVWDLMDSPLVRTYVSVTLPSVRTDTTFCVPAFYDLSSRVGRAARSRDRGIRRAGAHRRSADGLPSMGGPKASPPAPQRPASDFGFDRAFSEPDMRSLDSEERSEIEDCIEEIFASLPPLPIPVLPEDYVQKHSCPIQARLIINTDFKFCELEDEPPSTGSNLPFTKQTHSMPPPSAPTGPSSLPPPQPTDIQSTFVDVPQPVSSSVEQAPSPSISQYVTPAQTPPLAPADDGFFKQKLKSLSLGNSPTLPPLQAPLPQHPQQPFYLPLFLGASAHPKKGHQRSNSLDQNVLCETQDKKKDAHVGFPIADFLRSRSVSPPRAVLATMSRGHDASTRTLPSPPKGLSMFSFGNGDGGAHPTGSPTNPQSIFSFLSPKQPNGGGQHAPSGDVELGAGVPSAKQHAARSLDFDFAKIFSKNEGAGGGGAESQSAAGAAAKSPLKLFDFSDGQFLSGSSQAWTDFTKMFEFNTATKAQHGGGSGDSLDTYQSPPGGHQSTLSLDLEQGRGGDKKEPDVPARSSSPPLPAWFKKLNIQNADLPVSHTPAAKGLAAPPANPALLPEPLDANACSVRVQLTAGDVRSDVHVVSHAQGSPRHSSAGIGGVQPLPAKAAREGADSTSGWFDRLPFLGSGGTAGSGQKLSDSVILHFHGGGFIAMSTFAHSVYLRHWARDLNVPIVSVEYKKAPEYQFPVALHECFTVYKWVLENAEKIGTSAKRIILAGDSAGGNLCIGVVLRCIAERIRTPDALSIAYPALFLNDTPSPSRILGLIDPMVNYGFLRLCTASYLHPSHDRFDPLVSPGYAPKEYLELFPPTQIIVGSLDPIFDDSIAFARRLTRATGQVKLEVFDGLGHGFLNLCEFVPEAMGANKAVVDWMRQFV